MSDLEQRIKTIEDRNRNVEIGKAWEVSWTRRILLVVLTYLAIGIYMWAIDLPRPWLNAIVPAVAFVISTLTLPLFKSAWIKVFRVRK
ncbi:hypothetical protein A2810_02825 [candidate division Kazan bacterium RIFCSPHIGHO2_01_FULL_49_10]|uniref:Uncharacterized protein n=1 Tax=candidate division Kazan bacterium RIFCSPLOWO2_01_FULL_48_13 TaxID=1798539 RepID=A0A1F4PNM3_UNCK3|nr:MAG: hypothetical protein A2810_02825 [candidate division Kazan bacterium RIFCSPHIGHO2_01_FULL_49_10]OGB85281.1 MAG: hypothetical protein A2994_03285 [candidate division Kazan bacterium RIFCSPLOWO2_01_FULL_48_13]